jgi:hypothetical protein
MAQAGVTHWFAGHYHRNAGGVYRFSSHTSEEKNVERTIEVVTTGALGGNISTNVEGDVLGLSGMRGISLSESQSGMRVVNMTSFGVKHEFVTMNKCMPCA